MRPATLKLYKAAMAALAECPAEHKGNVETRIPGHGQYMVCLKCLSWCGKVCADIDKRRHAEGREDGREYWTRRNITLGETVYATGAGMFGPTRIAGVAKAGVNGAYVICTHWQTKGKQLVPDGWHKAA